MAKIRDTYTLMIKCFVRSEDFVKDKHTQSEQNEVTKSGVYYTQFHLWSEIILSSEVSLKKGDVNGLMSAAENLKSQLYRMYKKKNIRQPIFMFDDDFEIDIDNINKILRLN